MRTTFKGLAAQSNNPTILNPDFLRYNDIVDESWKLKRNPLCTEPFSQVIYRNAVSIIAQLDKVIFSINKIEDSEPFDSIPIIAKCAKKYIELITHVNYIGVGINPKCIIKINDEATPEGFILNNFINNKNSSIKPINAGFNISFSTNDNTVCSLNISSSKIKGQDGEQGVIVVGANFHHNVIQDIKQKIKQIKSIIDSFQNDVSFFETEILSKYFAEVKK